MPAATLRALHLARGDAHNPATQVRLPGLCEVGHLQSGDPAKSAGRHKSMVDPRRRHRQLAVFIVSLLLVNFPALAVIDGLRWADGVPVTPVYLFIVWIGMIALTAITVAGRRG